MKAIPTRYAGCHFRSRLEARWAVFFDHAGVPWEYEMQGLEMASGVRYLPDFYLPTVPLRSREDEGLWVEVKPPTKKVRETLVGGFLGELLADVAEQTGQPVALLVGSPDISTNFDEHYQYDASRRGWRWDNNMAFMACLGCDHVKFEYLESNYMWCDSCEQSYSPREGIIRDAVRAARSARFEHGETPT